MKRVYFILSIVFALSICSSYHASAQSLTGVKEEISEAVAPEFPSDSLGRRTPRGTLSGFIQAVADQNYIRASQYLNLSRSQRGPKERERLVKVFQRLLDQGGNIMPYAWVSDQTAGRTDDALPPGIDLVGTVAANGESINLFVENKQDPNEAALWQFSTATISALAAVTVGDDLLIDQILPEFLSKPLLGGVPVGHWLMLLVLIVVSYGISWAIIFAIEFMIRAFWRKARIEPTSGVILALAVPFRLYLAVWVFVFASQEIGISIIVRQRFSGITIIIGIVALLILLWRLTDYISIYSGKTMTRRGRVSAVSVILFVRRAAKVAIVVIGIIAILGTLGFDVTTGIAALGIGGLALALGAQKTIENFVGSVTLITDQPIRVGDYCTVGGTTGTVEQIGMRSTRIRTNARTIVTIPNGEFSSTRIENFATRDRFLFSPVLDIRYETTPDQIRYLLVELRSLLYSHPKVINDPAKVRFVGLGVNSLKIEIYTYIQTTTYDVFQEVQEDLLLRIMEIVAQSGSDFAFPSQTIYFAEDKGVSDEKMAAAEAKVRNWKEQNDLPLPNFDAERISKLKGTLDYPAKGSIKGKD